MMVFMMHRKTGFDMPDIRPDMGTYNILNIWLIGDKSLIIQKASN
jgi:hypothetical protein